jgi:hypothetical protein
MKVNDKVNTTLTFLRALLFLACSIIASITIEIDSNTCVFFIVAIIDLANVASDLNARFQEGHGRTMIRLSVSIMASIALAISFLAIDTVPDMVSVGAMAVQVAVQYYILSLSIRDSPEYEDKAKSKEIIGSLLCFFLFSGSLILDQSEFPHGLSAAVKYARSKIANIIFIAISADEFFDGMI